MAVAVKTNTGIRPAVGLVGLPLVSLVGGLFILASVVGVAYGLPALWAARVTPSLRPALGVFVDVGALIAVEVAAALALLVVAGRLLGREAPVGSRAGAAAVVLFLLLGALATVGSGHIIEYYVLRSAGNPTVGIGLTAGVGVAILVWGLALLQSRGFRKWIPVVEEGGWFTAAGYKPSQGQRVRRATLLGILLIVGAGIYTLLSHRSLEAGARDWGLMIPFGLHQALVTASDGEARLVDVPFVLIKDVPLVMPVILTALGLWFAYRVVNFPAFADFLTATEAEINKVSWASRKSLIQDTIVVLATVVLFTLFLLVVDVSWGFILSSKLVDVIHPVSQSQTDKTKADPARLDW